MASRAWFSSPCLGCACGKDPVYEPKRVTGVAGKEKQCSLSWASTSGDSDPQETLGSLDIQTPPLPQTSAEVGAAVGAAVTRTAGGPEGLPDNANSQAKDGATAGAPRLPTLLPTKSYPFIEGHASAASPVSCDSKGCEDNKSGLSIPVGSPGSCGRRRDRMRKLGKRVRTKQIQQSEPHVIHLKSSHNPALIEELSPEVTPLHVPADTPIVQEHFASVSLESIQKAITGDHDEGGPLASFLRQGLGVSDLEVSPWVDGVTEAGTLVQKKSYVMPMPTDTPEMIRRALRLPQAIPGSTVSCLGFSGDNLILSQRSSAKGVLYGERMRFQNTHVFRSHPAGGVEWCQWTQTIWLEPLPWTLSFLALAIQMKSAAQARAASQQFGKSLLAAASWVQASDAH